MESNHSRVASSRPTYPRTKEFRRATHQPHATAHATRSVRHARRARVRVARRGPPCEARHRPVHLTAIDRTARGGLTSECPLAYPIQSRERRGSLRALLAARERRGGCVWVVGWRPNTTHVWGARSLALAQWGRGGYISRPPAALAPELAGLARAPPPELTSCPICLEDYATDLPHPDHCSPSPRERWRCPNPRLAHFVCLTCDADYQSRANNRCPECRADRAAVLASV